MATSKSLEQIAKDIVRRLLPDATKFQEVANKRLKEHQEYVNNHMSNRERLLAMATPAFPIKPYGQGVETANIYTRHTGDCEIRVQGRSYKMTFDVPHDIGIRLLEVYKQIVEERGVAT